MFGNARQGGGGSNPWTRLSGLFQTKKGGWIARIEPKQFPAIIAVMKEAAQKNGTLTLLIMPDKSGKPAISMTAGDEYKPGGNTGGNAFGSGFAPQQQAPAPQRQQAAPQREVTFGQADMPAKDDLDSLLESF